MIPQLTSSHFNLVCLIEGDLNIWNDVSATVKLQLSNTTGSVQGVTLHQLIVQMSSDTDYGKSYHIIL